MTEGNWYLMAHTIAAQDANAFIKVLAPVAKSSRLTWASLCAWRPPLSGRHLRHLRHRRRSAWRTTWSLNAKAPSPLVLWLSRLPWAKRGDPVTRVVEERLA